MELGRWRSEAGKGTRGGLLHWILSFVLGQVTQHRGSQVCASAGLRRRTGISVPFSQGPSYGCHGARGVAILLSLHLQRPGTIGSGCEFFILLFQPVFIYVILRFGKRQNPLHAPSGQSHCVQWGSVSQVSMPRIAASITFLVFYKPLPGNKVVSKFRPSKWDRSVRWSDTVSQQDLFLLLSRCWGSQESK